MSVKTAFRTTYESALEPRRPGYIRRTQLGNRRIILLVSRPSMTAVPAYEKQCERDNNLVGESINVAMNSSRVDTREVVDGRTTRPGW